MQRIEPVAKTTAYRLAACLLLCVTIATSALPREKIPQQKKTGETASPTQETSGAPQLQFAFGGNVAQIPAQIADALALVPVRVNGSQPSWFLLDTTRATSAIDDVRAVAVGLYSPSSASQLPKSFSNVTLEFPGLRISLATLALDAFGDLSARIGHAVQGVLGADVMSQVVLKIDYERQFVQFYDPKAFRYGGRGAQIPLQVSAGVPAVEGKVSVRHRGKLEGLLAIDTGLSEPLAFSRHFAAAHAFSDLSEKMLPFPGEDAASDSDVRDFLGRVQVLQFGKVAFADPIAIFPAKSAKGPGDVPAQFACAMGGELLSRFTVILNGLGRMLILEPNKSFRDAFSADMSGLTIIAIPPAFNKFEVAQVAGKSPGFAAGVAVGDMIEKIDGRAASEYTLDDVKALLRQDGIARKLSILHNGKITEVTLRLKPLV